MFLFGQNKHSNKAPTAFFFLPLFWVIRHLTYNSVRSAETYIMYKVTEVEIGSGPQFNVTFSYTLQSNFCPHTSHQSALSYSPWLNPAADGHSVAWRNEWGCREKEKTRRGSDFTEWKSNTHTHTSGGGGFACVLCDRSCVTADGAVAATTDIERSFQERATRQVKKHQAEVVKKFFFLNRDYTWTTWNGCEHVSTRDDRCSL